MLQEAGFRVSSLTEDIEEELQMTFQVALVGSDGLIIGSDRRMTNRATAGAGAVPFAQYENRKKFLNAPDESVICSFIGTSEAQRIAGQVVENADPALSEYGWQNYLNELSLTSNPRLPDEVMVTRKGHPSEIVRMVLGAGASRIESHFCGGAIVPACFLTEHFSSRSPVSVLRRLALLTLDYGAREAPSSVGGGFDLLVLTSSGVEWESYSANDERILSLRSLFECATNQVLFG